MIPDIEPAAAAAALVASRPQGFHSQAGWAAMSDVERADAVLRWLPRYMNDAAKAVMLAGGRGSEGEQLGARLFLAHAMEDMGRRGELALIVLNAAREAADEAVDRRERRQRRAVRNAAEGVST